MNSATKKTKLRDVKDNDNDNDDDDDDDDDDNDNDNESDNNETSFTFEQLVTSYLIIIVKTVWGNLYCLKLLTTK